MKFFIPLPWDRVAYQGIRAAMEANVGQLGARPIWRVTAADSRRGGLHVEEVGRPSHFGEMETIIAIFENAESVFVVTASRGFATGSWPVQIGKQEPAVRVAYFDE